MELRQKTIVITGGTSGIGYELVKQLHSDNQIIVISSNLNKLQRLSQNFCSVVTYQTDLSKSNDIKALSTTIRKQHNSIDILINNAAVQYAPTFLDPTFKHDNIATEIATNFTSICSLTYLLLPALLHTTPSIILNVNSGLALAPKTSSAIYCATKGALNIFSQSLRYQLANTNIAVQQCFLPLVDTNMTTGRGKNKLSAEIVATSIIHGIEKEILEHDVGKVKWLRRLLRLSPSFTQKVMQKY